MAFTMMKSAVAGRAAAFSRRSTVSVKATSENVESAREWIGNWRDKQGANSNRTSWFPGSQLPDYLDGSLPGDFGFDPLRLGQDPGKLYWYSQAEVFHCRLAMLGVAGVLVPDLFKNIGLGGPAAQVAWYDAGAYPYFAPPKALFASMMLLFAWVEFRRLQDIRKPNSVNDDPIFKGQKLPDHEPGYPGGIFDPLGYSKGNMAEMKLKEVKNGRLAMMAFAGFLVQGLYLHQTPLESLSYHLEDPWNHNVWTNPAHLSAFRIAPQLNN